VFPVEGGEEGNWVLKTMTVWGCEGADRRAGGGVGLVIEEVVADEGAGAGLMVVAVTMTGDGWGVEMVGAPVFGVGGVAMLRDGDGGAAGGREVGFVAGGEVSVVAVGVRRGC
jgi:hypothetical protein